jgi:metal-sulfur cluster biosynthetic enzyme
VSEPRWRVPSGPRVPLAPGPGRGAAEPADRAARTALPVVPAARRGAVPHPAAEYDAAARGRASDRPNPIGVLEPGTESLWVALHDVRDPELPVSLVDLGLIYAIRRDGGTVEIDLTFTATACPCVEFIRQDVRDRLLLEPDVGEVRIREVWDPPWTTDRVTPEGRALLRSFGVAA